MYNILVVGAGYLGAMIAREFRARKQRVFAMTRNVDKGLALQNEEIQPVIADLLQPETLAQLPDAHFIVISVAPDQSDENNYRKIYLDGVRNFLDSRKKKARPHLIVLISSTSVWKDRNGDWVDEDTPVDADTEKGKILIGSEHMVLNSGFPAVVLRLSGIYGPGRNRLQPFKLGVWPQEIADGFMNMIHVEDAARAMLPIFKNSKEGNVYLGTDDAPVLRSEFCSWLSEKTGKPIVGNIDKTRVEGKRCRNSRLRELGVSFLYPSFKEGYNGLLNKEGKV